MSGTPRVATGAAAAPLAAAAAADRGARPPPPPAAAGPVDALVRPSPRQGGSPAPRRVWRCCIAPQAPEPRSHRAGESCCSKFYRHSLGRLRSCYTVPPG